MDDAYAEIGFPNEVSDPSVDTILEMLRDEYQFEHNVWEGGVKAGDVDCKKRDICMYLTKTKVSLQM
ncbi:unnamed protein product [Arabis nemorensis]|uniref:Uncharacterized protein n=1 Tax=Arabis nemorensis TaxID=586526 RepID=A0A565C3S8_9BRAS|nr:unnamed protein product [Arabis nemorensis]